VTVQAGANYGDARSTTITISGGGIARTIDVSQAQGRFTASTTGSIQFNNLLYEQVTSRLYLRLINTNNESEYISLCERLDIMNSGEKNTKDDDLTLFFRETYNQVCGRQNKTWRRGFKVERQLFGNDN
jgi:hypothetical protein